MYVYIEIICMYVCMYMFGFWGSQQLTNTNGNCCSQNKKCLTQTCVTNARLQQMQQRVRGGGAWGAAAAVCPGPGPGLVKGKNELKLNRF